jgi:acyl carrier protein
VHTNDEINARILEIVRATLHNDEIAASDNVFAVGGDSLSLVEICTALEGEFGVELPLEDVWDADDITRLGNIVRTCLMSTT